MINKNKYQWSRRLINNILEPSELASFIFQRGLKKIVFLFSFLFFNTIFASIEVQDTIAGYSAVIRLADLEPEQELSVVIEKPTGTKIKLPVITDNSGSAQLEFDSFHTKQAGDYLVNLISTSTDLSDENVGFHVFPAKISKTDSKLYASKQSLSTGDDLTLRVVLRDVYQNAITGHRVKLISSRTNDVITSTQEFSDDNGQAVFNVQSNEPGVSVFSAFDQDLDEEINDRMKVVFYEKEDFGTLFSANLLDSENTFNDEYLVLDHFEIDFPDQVAVHSDQNYLKVTAKDKNNNTVKSYTGTIKLAVEGDDNAILPNEGQYTFTDKDQGVKEFALALIFTKVTDIKLTIYDFENGQVDFNLTGEKNISVVKQKDFNDQNIVIDENTNKTIEIKSPTNGSKLASSVISVSGLAKANTNLKLMLNDTKVQDISVDNQGFFSALLTNMNDGEYEIYLIESEGNRQSSVPVTFFIDSTKPVIDRFEIFPDTKIYPETSYTLTVWSEKDLDNAFVRVNNFEENLVQSALEKGKYEVVLFSPSELGNYQLDVFLTDLMGNKGEYFNVGKINVVEEVIIKPEIPKSINIQVQDKEADISWEQPESVNNIDHYRVYLGQDINNLTLYSKSKGLKTLITKLNNDQKYFVSVSAVDVQGVEGEQSQVLEFTPVKPQVEIIEDLHSAMPEVPPLRSIAGNSKVTLSWDTFNKANYYQVMFGIKSSKYEVEIITSETSIVIDDLINDLSYYFTVVALDANKKPLSDYYPEIIDTPQGYMAKIKPSLKKIPSIQVEQVNRLNNTGPEIWIFIAVVILSLVFTLVFYFPKTNIIRKTSKSSALYKNNNLRF